MTGTTIPYDNMSTETTSTPLFTKCCFCFPIRVGCFILGYLSLLINLLHSFMVLSLVTVIGVATHGFDHFDSPENMQIEDRNELEVLEKPILKRLEFVLVIVLLANFIWLVINIACLVGLHKKRPGPVRMYAAFASVKLIFSLAAFIFLVSTRSSSLETVISESIDFIFAGYFILVYYVYAKHLQREEIQKLTQVSEAVNNVSFIYPTKLDKHTLVA